MKRILIISALLFAGLSLFAQYPNNARKQRLGFQTTGAGLVYIQSGAPAHTPSTDENTWMVLDTTNNVLYYWDETAGAWENLLDDVVRDTVFQITSVPDTSLLVPLQGDAFINSTRDTMGLYSGTAWVLFYGGSGLTDGDKGDIDVTSSGAVWTIDTNAVTVAKIFDDVLSSVNFVVNDGGNIDLASEGDITVTPVQDSLKIFLDLADGAVDWDELSAAVQDSIQAGGGGGVSGSGAATRVAYWDGTTSLTSDVNFAWSGKQLTLKSSTGTNNVFINGGNTTATGTGNFSGTASSLGSLTSGNYNIGIGLFSVNAVTSNTSNIGIGYQAAQKVATGNSNIALGGEALRELTDGQYNLAIGTSSMRGLTTGSNNIGIGWSALIASGSYSSNVAIGERAMANLASGNNNTAISPRAGQYTSAEAALTAASNSVFIGYDTRANAISESNQIVIGYQAIGHGSNTVTLGNSSITTHYLSGTGGVSISSGSTAQRPTGANGVIRYNTTTSAFEGYSNSTYRAFYQESTADPTSILGKVIGGLAGEITPVAPLSLSSGELSVSQRYANLRKASGEVYAFSTTPELIDTLDGSVAGSIFTNSGTGTLTYTGSSSRVFQVSWSVTFSSDTAGKEVTWKVYQSGTGSDYNQATQYAATAGKKYTASGVYQHSLSSTNTIDIRGYLDSGTANVTVHNISISVTEL